MKNDEMTNAWDELLERGISEETLHVVTSINGYNMETMRDVLYVISAERYFWFESED